MAISKTYSLTTDFLNGYNESLFINECNNSSISVVLNKLEKLGTDITFFFSGELLASDITILDSLVANHNEASPIPDQLIASQAQLSPGGVFSLTFFNHGKVMQGKKLYSKSYRIDAEHTPLISPFKCQLIGAVYANKIPSSDIDIIISKINCTDSNTPIQSLETWQIRSNRIEIKNYESMGIFVNPGDKVFLEAIDAGVDAEKFQIDLWFKVIDTTITSQGWNWTGNIN